MKDTYKIYGHIDISIEHMEKYDKQLDLLGVIFWENCTFFLAKVKFFRTICARFFCWASPPCLSYDV